MYCSKCGTQLAEGTAFCGACGQPTGAVGVGVATAPPPVAISGASVVPAYAAPGSVNPYAAPIVPGMPYAGFWLRFLAYLIDGVVIGMVFGIFVLILIGIVGIGYFRDLLEGINVEDSTIPMAFITFIILLSLFSLLAGWLYHAWMESSRYQGTLGKMALGLVVTDLRERPITFARASGRFFAKLITGLIPFCIGYIMAGFTEKKQALHDMIASCLVLRKV
jgi:uncharacterized RDD family membrane protein YckC